MFNERLKKYRIELGIAKKKQMAQKLGISEQLYSMLESGSRKPSNDVMKKLVDFSGIAEEYWEYGNIGSKTLEEREELKDTKNSINLLINLGLIKDENLTDETLEVLIAALKADIKHILLKKKEV